jgi:hypothetical protein
MSALSSSVEDPFRIIPAGSASRFLCSLEKAFLALHTTMATEYQLGNKGKPLYEVAEGALIAAECTKKDAATIVEAAKDYNELQGWHVK